MPTWWMGHLILVRSPYLPEGTLSHPLGRALGIHEGFQDAIEGREEEEDLAATESTEIRGSSTVGGQNEGCLTVSQGVESHEASDCAHLGPYIRPQDAGLFTARHC